MGLHYRPHRPVSSRGAEILKLWYCSHPTLSKGRTFIRVVKAPSHTSTAKALAGARSLFLKVFAELSPLPPRATTQSHDRTSDRSREAEKHRSQRQSGFEGAICASIFIHSCRSEDPIHPSQHVTRQRLCPGRSYQLCTHRHRW